MNDIQMTVYDFNKEVYRNVPRMASTEFNDMINNIVLWFSSKHDGHYFMMLSKELSDYTIFHFDSFNYDKARQELVSLITQRGLPLDIDYVHETDTYDIWIKHRVVDDSGKDTVEPVMYKIFQCDDFVIEI